MAFLGCTAALASTSGKLGNIDILLYEEYEPGNFLSRAEFTNKAGQTLRLECQDHRDTCDVIIPQVSICEGASSKNIQIYSLPKGKKQMAGYATCHSPTAEGLLQINDPDAVEFILSLVFDDGISIGDNDTGRGKPIYSFEFEKKWSTAATIVMSFHHIVQNPGLSPPYFHVVMSSYSFLMRKMDTFPEALENCGGTDEETREANRTWQKIVRQLKRSVAPGEYTPFKNTGDFHAWMLATLELMQTDPKLNKRIDEDILACAIGLNNLWAKQHQYQHPHAIKPDAEYQRIKNNREELCTKFKRGFKYLNC